MVANFAMSVLNGVGGAKLEKIINIDDTSFTNSNPISINLNSTYKYVILEVCYAEVKNIIPYLNIGPQLFFLDNNTDSYKYVVAVAMASPDSILSSGMHIAAYVVNNIVTIKHGHGSSTSMTLTGNIYCFN